MKMQARDPLEEVDLGDGDVKIPTYISAKVDPYLKEQVVKLLKDFKDFFAWDYNEMPRLNREIVELRLPIRPSKKPLEKLPRRFSPEIMFKIK